MLNNELSNLDFDVAALQETWLKSGIQKFDNLHYSIVDQKVKNMNLVADFT